MFAQVQDGITHQLTGTVVGNISSSVRFHQLNTHLEQILWRYEQVFGMGNSPQSDDRRAVFQKQKGVRDGTLSPLPHEFSLHLPCRGVVYTT